MPEDEGRAVRGGIGSMFIFCLWLKPGSFNFGTMSLKVYSYIVHCVLGRSGLRLQAEFQDSRPQIAGCGVNRYASWLGDFGSSWIGALQYFLGMAGVDCLKN